MNNDSVSVIIPMYNSEKTIRRTINSALRQTVSSLEVICVDDGSEDGTKSILKELSQEHSEIIILCQEHSGPGVARNQGIKSSKGKYIAFLDSDDEYVDETALEIMIKACNDNEAVICGSNRIVNENGIDRDAGLFLGFKVPENGCFIEYSDYQKDYDYQSFVFDRSFILENGVEFPDYMRYEDPVFFLNAMSAAGKFYALPVTLYKYNFNKPDKFRLSGHVDHILRGITDNLRIGIKKGYKQIVNENLNRINNEYREAILYGLSDEVMGLLLAINMLSKEHDGTELELVSYIYKSARDNRNLGLSHMLLEKTALLRQEKNTYNRYFADNNLHTVAVYGLGKFGKILVEELTSDGVEIAFAIDRAVTEYKDLKIYTPDSEIPPCDIIIVSLVDADELLTELKKKWDVRIFSFSELVDEIKGLEIGKM